MLLALLSLAERNRGQASQIDAKRSALELVQGHVLKSIGGELGHQAMMVTINKLECLIDNFLVITLVVPGLGLQDRSFLR
jgi:hypothetical protein